MPYGPSSRLTGAGTTTTLQGGTTRTASTNSGKSQFGIAASNSKLNRPSSALISPRGGVSSSSSAKNGDVGGTSILSHYQQQSDIVLQQRATNNGSRASSISRISRSNTPGAMNNSFSHNRSLLPGGGTSPNIPVPKTTQAAMEEFSKPTAAAEARNASSSVLVERLRNIVSNHEERNNNNNNNNAKNNATASSSSASSGFATSQHQRQMEAMRQQSVNRMNVQRGLEFESSNNNDRNNMMSDYIERDLLMMNGGSVTSTTRVVPNDSRTYSTTNRIMVGSYLEAGGSEPTSPAITTPATSAPNSAMKPNKGKTRTAWQGGMEYSDDDHEHDDDDEDDEEYEEESEEEEGVAAPKSKITPQRPPLPQQNQGGDGSTPGSNPRSRNVSPQNTSPMSPSSILATMKQQQHQTTTMNTTAIAGFSWCRDWTRRGMRPDDVAFNEQNRVSLEATSHVEPRGLDMWHHVFDKSLAGSFLCRRCGLPVFESSAMTRPVARAGHITFSQRLARTTVPELCPKDSKIIIKCARCRGFLADLYDVQSKTIPPLLRASSWSLWHDESVRVPENLAQSVGPYIEEEEDGMDEEDLQKMLDRVDPLMTADDFFK